MPKRQQLERSIRKVKDSNPAWAARMQKELEPLEVPLRVKHLLDLFDRLNFQRRTHIVTSLAGAIVLQEPLCVLRLEAHLRLHRRELTPWEVETIELMDMAFLEESAKLRG